MKRSVFYIVSALVVVMVVGCEDNDRTSNNYNYYNSGSYYNDETYVSVDVRNDSGYLIAVIVGNAEYCRMTPGEQRTVYRSLIGNEKLRITILFLDIYGNPLAQDGEYSFDRDFSEYHMNIRGPGSVRVY